MSLRRERGRLECERQSVHRNGRRRWRTEIGNRTFQKGLWNSQMNSMTSICFSSLSSLFFLLPLPLIYFPSHTLTPSLPHSPPFPPHSAFPNSNPWLTRDLMDKLQCPSSLFSLLHFLFLSPLPFSLCPSHLLHLLHLLPIKHHPSSHVQHHHPMQFHADD